MDIVALTLLIVAVVFVARAVKVVPQQSAWASTTARSRPA